MFELVIVVAIALLFDFTNGFHDAANSIATPSRRVDLAAPRGRSAPASSTSSARSSRSNVAKTIGKGIVDPGAITMRDDPRPASSARSPGTSSRGGAACRRRRPTRSSAASRARRSPPPRGFDVVNWRRPADEGDRAVASTSRCSASSPGGGAGAAACAGRVGRYLDARPAVRGMQLVSAGFVALTHGTNDAQKTMGVIAPRAGRERRQRGVRGRRLGDRRARRSRSRSAPTSAAGGSSTPSAGGVRARPARRASRRRRRRRSCSGAPPTSASRSRPRR